MVIVANDIPRCPAVGADAMMPLPARWIRLARRARYEGARDPKHGKQGLPMAG